MPYRPKIIFRSGDYRSPCQSLGSGTSSEIQNARILDLISKGNKMANAKTHLERLEAINDWYKATGQHSLIKADVHNPNKPEQYNLI